MATLGSTIEEVRRLLMPIQPMQIALGANYTAASGTITLAFGSPVFPAVQVGTVLGIGLNVLLVTGTPNTGTGVTPVAGGQQGSTDANATSGTLADINPRFTRWDISQVINEEIQSLDAPSAGLGQIIQNDSITFVPVFWGYDLGPNFDNQRSSVLEVSYKIAPPYRTYPLIRRGEYRVIRNADTTVFPNGVAMVISKPGWPGFPITVQFLAPFQPLVNLSDDLLTVSGIPVQNQDIIYMGAMLRLAPDREISRNDMSRQPDPRKAPEVPPGAMMASTNSLAQRYARRINEAASIIKRAYPQREWV